MHMGRMKNESLVWGVGLRRACVTPNTLTDGVPKVPKGNSEELLAFLAPRHLMVFEKHTTTYSA
jgi:hypothetical protein